MRTVEIDRDADGTIKVTWMQGMQPPKSRRFTERAEAEAFAEKTMGARGCVISTLDMTAEQLAAHKARQARAAAIAAQIDADRTRR